MTTTTTITTIEKGADFIELTRVYKLKDVPANAPKYDSMTGEKLSHLKTQPIIVAVAAITSVRPSNRLGFPEHRTTITLADGTIYDLANKLSEVRNILMNV